MRPPQADARGILPYLRQVHPTHSSMGLAQSAEVASATKAGHPWSSSGAISDGRRLSAKADNIACADL